MTTTVADWNAYSTEEGEPWAAFVQGHVDIATLTAAPEQIIEAYKQLDDMLAEMVSEAFAGEDAQKMLRHFFLKPSAEDGMYHFCEATDEGAFPVTGIKFL